MAEWGPSEVREAEIRTMEERGLALEQVFTIGWHPPSVEELAPSP
jgi:hypothetical protein